MKKDNVSQSKHSSNSLRGL